MASAAHISHVALGKIVNGHTQSPRPRHVKALAEALGVPVQWLTGQWDRLPFVPFPDALDFRGQGMRWRTQPKLTNVSLTFRDKNGRVVRTTAPAPDVADYPPDFLLSTQVVLNQFLTECYTALVRDLEACFGEERVEGELNKWGMALLRILVGIVTPRSWSSKCLDPGFVIQDEDSLTSLVAAWEGILEPWFDGRGSLEIHTIGSIARLLNLEQPRRLTALKKRASALARSKRNA